jgi:ABC-type bacteriocin/lantibiotic exporter with double-glycine peptidase domain
MIFPAYPATLDTIKELPPTPAVVRTFASLNIQSPISIDSEYIVRMPKRALTAYREVYSYSLPLLKQEGNTCGPTSLTMVLLKLGVKSYTTADGIRDTFCSEQFGTSPVDIKNAAIRHGFEAIIRNNSTDECLKHVIREGGYAIVILDKGEGLHYAVVNGFRVSREGDTQYLVSDPNGWQKYIPAKTLHKEWDQPLLKGRDLGMSNCMIVISKEKIIDEQFGGLIETLSKLHSTVNVLQEVATTFLTFLANMTISISAGNATTPPTIKVPNLSETYPD